MHIPEEIQAQIWKVYFKEHVMNSFLKQVNKGGLDVYPIALSRRTGLRSIYLKLDISETVSCDYGEINDYDWDVDTPFVNLPDSKRPKYWKHYSLY